MVIAFNQYELFIWVGRDKRRFPVSAFDMERDLVRVRQVSHLVVCLFYN